MTAGRAGAAPPVLVKLAPDLAPEDIDAAVDLALERGVAGVIVTNTTLSREGLVSPEALPRPRGRPVGRAAARRAPPASSPGSPGARPAGW